MKAKTKFESPPQNFWEFYIIHIRPKLMEIDILLRSLEESMTLSVSDTATVLSLSSEEVLYMMKQKNISAIDIPNFLQLMESGSSAVCRLYKREIECGSPFTYTREQIAYIYGLDIETVTAACDQLGIKEATAHTLPELFLAISPPQ